MASPTPDQKRSIALEYKLRVGVRTIADVCEKYGLTRGAFRRLRDEVGHPFASSHELVIACLCTGPATLDALIGELDYRDHARYPEEQVLGWLSDLSRHNIVRCLDDRWSLTPERAATHARYVFTDLP